MNIKKVFSLGLCTVMAVSLAACGNNDEKTNDDSDNVQIPNPFTEYQTLEEAEKDAGFLISLPEVIEGFDSRRFYLDKDSGLLEVIYENGDETITFRKSNGEGDISGNYNEFSEQNDVDGDGITVTVKGNDGKVNLATWSKDGYAYSIDCTTAVERVVMTDYIKTVNAEGYLIGGDPSTWGPDLDKGENVQIPSPFIPCNNMDEAVKIAGFTMIVPNTPDTIEASEDMIQVFYGEDGDDLFIRKAVGDGDISGDYNEYAQVETVDGVTLKVEKDVFSLALWTKDGYTYSVSVGEALDQSDMEALIASIR